MEIGLSEFVPFAAWDAHTELLELYIIDHFNHTRDILPCQIKMSEYSERLFICIGRKYCRMGESIVHIGESSFVTGNERKMGDQCIRSWSVS